MPREHIKEQRIPKIGKRGEGTVIIPRHQFPKGASITSVSNSLEVGLGHSDNKYTNAEQGNQNTFDSVYEVLSCGPGPQCVPGARPRQQKE